MIICNSPSTSLLWRVMGSDTIVTLFKGNIIWFFILLEKWPNIVLSFRILYVDLAGNSCRWRCMISPLWISTCSRLRLKRTTIRPKGGIEIRACLQVINEVSSVFLCSLFPLFQLPKSNRICFKMSSSQLFEKVSVAGPFHAVMQVFLSFFFAGEKQECGI